MVSVTEIKRKLCIIGDWGVGKTSLIRRFVLDQFDDKYLMTIGCKVYKKRLKFQKDKDNIIDLKLVIWDIMGQKEFKMTQRLSFQGTNGTLIVCDVTRKNTLSSINQWREDLFKITEKIPIIILANKADLGDKAEFTIEDLEWVSKKIQAPYFFTSAKTGENVETAFREIGIKFI